MRLTLRRHPVNDRRHRLQCSPASQTHHVVVTKHLHSLLGLETNLSENLGWFSKTQKILSVINFWHSKWNGHLH